MRTELLTRLNDGIEVWRTSYGSYDQPRLIAVLAGGEAIVLDEERPLEDLKDLRELLAAGCDWVRVLAVGDTVGSIVSSLADQHSAFPEC